MEIKHKYKISIKDNMSKHLIEALKKTKKRNASIPAKALEIGDIFCHEVKGKERESFEVLEIPKGNTFLCGSRNTGFNTRKSTNTDVIFLRNIKVS